MRQKGRNAHLNNTEIEYVDMTWNPVTGCLRGCSYCYARKLANGRVRARYLANTNVLAGDPSDPFAPRYWPNRLDGPSRYKRSKAIFVVDMGDLFGARVSDMVISRVIAVAYANPQHDFLFLTKCPNRMASFQFPDNAWVGATVTNSRQLKEAALSLKHVKAKHKFVSFEPLQELLPSVWLEHLALFTEWFIIGAQTKPEIQPEASWVEAIHAIADKHSIPVFHKDNLRTSLERRMEWPDSYRKGARDAMETSV